ncbi:MAG TPA: carboxypeptidase-like regulatory domain-containing protein, partial [Terriglobia bacterium]|nr:carboxypeptidase-like regulatory domain-containing protein [Terriglobia bacterium]
MAILLITTPQDSTGSIAGHIRYADGSPAVRIRIAAFDVPDSKGMFSSDPVSQTTTDSDGRYRLASLPSNKQYRVLYRFRYLSDIRDEDWNRDAAIAVQSGRETLRDIVFPYPSKGVTVSGRIHGDLRSLRPRRVSLYGSGVDLNAALAVDGTFSFNGVAPGTYKLGMPIAAFAWGTREVVIGDRDLTGMELFMNDTIVSTGRVVVEGGGPVPRFSILMENPQGTSLHSYMWTVDTSRSSGMVAFSGWTDRPNDVVFNTILPIGQYRMSLSHLPEGYSVKAFRYGSTNLLRNSVTIDGEIRQLFIVLTKKASVKLVKLSGRLLFDAPLSSEIPTSRISLYSNQTMVALESPIGPDGSFEIDQIPPGVYDFNSPEFRTKIVIGKNGMNGLEFRASQIQAHWNELV